MVVLSSTISINHEVPNEECEAGCCPCLTGACLRTSLGTLGWAFPFRFWTLRSIIVRRQELALIWRGWRLVIRWIGWRHWTWFIALVFICVGLLHSIFAIVDLIVQLEGQLNGLFLLLLDHRGRCFVYLLRFALFFGFGVGTFFWLRGQIPHYLPKIFDKLEFLDRHGFLSSGVVQNDSFLGIKMIVMSVERRKQGLQLISIRISLQHVSMLEIIVK